MVPLILVACVTRSGDMDVGMESFAGGEVGEVVAMDGGSVDEMIEALFDETVQLVAIGIVGYVAAARDMPSDIDDLKTGLLFQGIDPGGLDKVRDLVITEEEDVLRVEGGTDKLPIFRIVMDMNEIELGEVIWD